MGLRPRDGGGARRKIGRLTVDVPPLLLLLLLLSAAAAAVAAAAADEVAAVASSSAEDEEAYPQDGSPAVFLSAFKRFSMNYQDLVDPNSPNSWRNTLQAPPPKKQPSKRFSMNFQDVLTDSDPRSWKSTLSTGSSGGGQPSSPASAAAAKEKRFSMNYLDTIGDTDPRSWQNTIDDKPPGRSAVRRSGGGGGRRRRQEFQTKRSRGGFADSPSSALLQLRQLRQMPLQQQQQQLQPGGGGRSVQLASAIDALAVRMAEVFGPEAVCGNRVMVRLLRMKEVLMAGTPGYSGISLQELCYG